MERDERDEGNNETDDENRMMMMKHYDLETHGTVHCKAQTSTYM